MHKTSRTLGHLLTRHKTPRQWTERMMSCTIFRDPISRCRTLLRGNIYRNESDRTSTTSGDETQCSALTKHCEASDHKTDFDGTSILENSILSDSCRESKSFPQKSPDGLSTNCAPRQGALPVTVIANYWVISCQTPQP